MSKISDQFNALPYDVRHIAAMSSVEIQINQLRIDRAKIVKHHRSLLRDIDQHIKNLEEYLQSEIAIDENVKRLAHSPAAPVADESL